MEYLFSATEQLIQDRTRDLGSVIDERPTEGGDDRLHREQVKQERLKDQMTNIGASLCINMEDRVRFASTYVSLFSGEYADVIDKLMVISMIEEVARWVSDGLLSDQRSSSQWVSCPSWCGWR